MIDLTQLPAPAVIEELDFETIYANKLARFQPLYPDYSAALESDPVVKLLELAAYDEMMLRARINDAAKATMLAYATGADLDHVSALLNVARLLVDPGDPGANPPRDPVYEDDERLRFRAQMALEGTSVAGSVGAYVFHALSASAGVADVSVDAPRFARIVVSPEVAAMLPPGAIVLQVTHSAGLVEPMPGDVAVNVLAVQHNEDNYAELLPVVESNLSADSIRPLTDHPHVLQAEAVHYRIRGTLEFDPGPDPAVAEAAARLRFDALIAARHKLGADMPRSAIFAALHGPGVARVLLDEPVGDVMCGINQFPLCDGIEISRAL
ncbi:phage-related baseplate assembly protein [Vogesella indigofera]|uniref:Phage-related baseplate assembly protein n=1 Tax=Vogesella indigofera TaxID=45465 RepID=A0A495BKE9_VOGIN|nr:baseplate J/gp47 family protein [Vogesella indigofera]RKQ61371.1 phage-related baseplate assembly protein [Vogesella indigofera]